MPVLSNITSVLSANGVLAGGIAAVFTVAGIAIAMTLHEFARAVVSVRMGDVTPRFQKRLTLNPLKHMEPIGFLLMLLFGYGWSKPAETNPAYYKDRRRGTLIAQITPTVFNIFVCALFCTGSRILTAFGGNQADAGNLIGLTQLFLLVVARCNLCLAIFNCIPVPPMDGARVLEQYLSAKHRIAFGSYEKIYQVVLLLLIFTSILQRVLDPIVNTVLKVLG